MLPMGSIVTVTMLLGLLFATPYAVKSTLKPLPRWISYSVGVLVLLAGVWNVFWYALQHLTEYWGIAALISGALMMITAGYIMGIKLPNWMSKIRPLVLIALLACMLHYGITIYRL